MAKTAPRVFFARVKSAVRRRCRATLQNFSPPSDVSSVAAAIDWLHAYRHETGLRPTPIAKTCPLLTAAAVPTLLSFGEVALARRFTDWLVSIKRPDGSFAPLELDRGSLIGTARALGALLAWGEADVDDKRLSAERAAAWLASRIDAAGGFNVSDHPLTNIDRWSAPA
ncbi:MAG: hypothetical protein ACREJM_07300, partial [Candidatus Saccharimonadales bacterium]